MQMKIAIISLRERFGDVTGDCVQAEKTTAALCELGEDAARYYLEPMSGQVYDANNDLIGDWQKVMSEVDIIHTIPPIPFGNLPSCAWLKAKLVTSTVFWCSPTYWKVELRNKRKIDANFIKLIIREIAAHFGIKLLTAKDGYDLLLPNSEDEIRCVRKYCKLKKGAILSAVPNAIDPIPDWVKDLPRLGIVPNEDYVLVPGFFAPRKNQMTLIKALSDFEHPVVFMGKGPMLEECKAIAPKNMIFLGHIEHGSKEFYSLMKYARVVCLPSNCETPGIAGLEGAALGARPVVPYEGGTAQYYDWDAEYHDPLSAASINNAIESAWKRGRLNDDDVQHYTSLTWKVCAKMTLSAYNNVLEAK